MTSAPVMRRPTRIQRHGYFTGAEPPSKTGDQALALTTASSIAIATATPATSTASTTASSATLSFFASASAVYGSAAALRAVLLVYGLWQDAHSPVKYTDIDYLVFTDAARFVAHSDTPYARETYRYTPLLAWLLLPAGWDSASIDTGTGLLAQALFASGKVLFAISDLVAGWFLERVLVQQLDGHDGPSHHSSRSHSRAARARARMYASVWLLNPMVAAISTRGSAEGLLGALVAALLWTVIVARKPGWAGMLLGAGVHLKIYPFIYAPAIVWWMDAEHMAASPGAVPRRGPRRPALTDIGHHQNVLASIPARIVAFLTPARLQLATTSLATFAALNAAMYSIYGLPFLEHTYLHHLTRIDHRHNFSPYNTQLYQASAAAATSVLGSSSNSSNYGSYSSADLTSWATAERLAFVPQLLLAAVLLPLLLAKKDLAATLLAQTFAFVAFNKVCTSQYFLWYMVLLPTYLPRSSLLRHKRKGLLALALWVIGQAVWLQQAFALEFLGQSTFVPGLWWASLGFFLVNCWILGILIEDVGAVAD